MAVLKLKKFNMEMSSNMSDHWTEYYNNGTLILRRGYPIRITLNFNRPIQKGDKVQFIATTGPSPEESDKTMAIFSLSDSESDYPWSAFLESSSSADVNVVITSPADAVIGYYNFNMHILSKRKSSHFKLHNFILLFNPWCEDDLVYMEDENERQEYVLNDSGIIYYGLEDYIDQQGWNFGQFEENILDICLTMLDKSLNYQEDPVLDCSKRNDPAYVGRVVSAMINSFEDEGVVEGQWTGNFLGGVDPKTWSGSVEILTKWQRSRYKPVKYGQCWVFAGVMCTVLRCLGIPTRVVTNFASAHDKNGNLMVDNIYTTSGRNKSKDTLWNYHVWNESWFKRNDLGSEYEGWQVLDATPQELSKGVHRCGPTSVHAIKEGDVHLDYDAAFVFSEVNADRVTWIYYDKDIQEKVYSNTSFVGKHISTKSVDSDERADITESYKYPEGSEEERQVYLKARNKLKEMGDTNEKVPGKRGVEKKRKRKRNHDAISPDADEKPAKLDVTGKFKLVESPKFGDDINLKLLLKNSVTKRHSVKVKLSSSTIEYTGIPFAEVFTDEISVTLDSMEEKEIPLSIAADDFMEGLTKDALIEVAALCELKSKKKMLVRKVVSVEKPPLHIKPVGIPVVDKPFELEIVFTNPLSETVTDGVMVLGGSGLIKKQLKKKLRKLEPNVMSAILVEIIPYRSGTKQLVVDFTSKKFPTIKGFLNIEVLDTM
ncbi:protein-glutamine gamma-glutamyltransferase E-like isoform X2 [Bombina bombina]|uniref:protein-glutamine gamma-glutamyltransferase E-like isoform X1 n=1 Tax=Bombina bombina TaxID=8345 RepID=UPI00235A4CE9|nr:protein-glutamine gamma-glutamyltransferase E-like isoform X1 [Bombina bombina]XP_053575233.1 protein-glutamine gamma-glutamyltransferase E-like isoform X2 [Bombina bombina]